MNENRAKYQRRFSQQFHHVLIQTRSGDVNPMDQRTLIPYQQPQTVNIVSHLTNSLDGQPTHNDIYVVVKATPFV
jgi:hypothetical protein